MRLFEVAKVGMFLDQVTHGIESRSGDEIKIVTLTLRVQPFTAELARAVEGAVRSTLFKLNTGEPQPHLKRVIFTLGVPRQQLQVYAAPDTADRSIAFDQVKIIEVYARTEKNVNGYALVIKASFGPVGKDELEYLQAWLLGQRFVTTEQAQGALFPDDDEDDDFEPEPPARPAPMFDDEEVAP